MVMMVMEVSPPPVFIPFALYPAGLLFHVLVFITKSNILLCEHCHPSPGASDFGWTCGCGDVCVCTVTVSGPPVELWQGVRAAQRHMCRNPAALLSAAGRSFAGKFKAAAAWRARGEGGWHSKKNEYTLVPKLNYGLHKHVMASTRARRIQTWPVRFTHLVKPISECIFIHTCPHTGSVTPAWPETLIPPGSHVAACSGMHHIRPAQTKLIWYSYGLMAT